MNEPIRKNFIIKISPLIRLPISKTQVFSYSYFQDIAPGTLVKIPFSSRMISGIVLESNFGKNIEQKFRLKGVSKIIKESLLAPKQLELAKLLADYYLAPLGVFLATILPRESKVRKTKAATSTSRKKIKPQMEAREILAGKSQEIVLAGARVKRQEINLSLMKRVMDSSQQCLYLASETIAAWTAYEKFSRYFPENATALFYSGMPQGQYFSNWNKVMTGEAKIIVATKIGVFLPFQNLRLIIIDEEQDKSFKQWDASPRYSAIEACRFLARLTDAKIIFSDSVPSLAAYKNFQEKKLKMKYYKFPDDILAAVKIINIYKEKLSADFPITKDLYKLISSAIVRKNKILLLVARRGFSSFSVCRKCKNVLKCPQCERALVYFEEAEKYCCLQCSYKMDLLTACPECGACNFSHHGTGIDLVEKKLLRLFPSAKLAKITRNISKSERNRNKFMKMLQQNDIILGTQVALKLADIEQFGLVAFANFDDLANYPDFNSNETSYSQLCQAANLVEAKGTLLIQTNFWENELLKDFASGKFEIFCEKELRQRKRMNLPPYTKMMKLAYRDKSKAAALSESQKTFDLLRRLGNNEIEISEPYEPLVSKKRAYFSQYILIKIKNKKPPKYLSIYPAIAALGKGWAIDVDPISTL